VSENFTIFNANFQLKLQNYLFVSFRPLDLKFNLQSTHVIQFSGTSNMKRNLELLWEEWEGRLLLINIANQLEARIIRRVDIDPFLKKAKKPGVDFSTRIRALMDEAPGSGDFRESSLYSTARVGPDCRKGHVLLRIAPMQKILDSIELTGTDPAFLRERLARASEQLAVARQIAASIAEKNLVRNSELLFRRHLFADNLVGSNFSDWNLSDCLTNWPLVQGRLIRSGVALRTPSRDPVFFTPLGKNSAISQKFVDASLSAAPSDLLRDTLGLDHYGSSYRNERVILGFYLVRRRQIKEGKALRPTPFDATSPGRFRACYGSFGGRIGKMGQTADLSRVGTLQSVGGAREVVCPNNELKTGNEDVLIGYLGPIKDPRNDAYVQGRSATQNDLAFLDSCAGLWDKSKVIETILGKKPHDPI
jgi:hypothetical protein